MNRDRRAIPWGGAGLGVGDACRIEFERRRLVRRGARAPRAAQRERRPQMRVRARVAPHARGLTDDLPWKELAAHTHRGRIDASSIEQHVDMSDDGVTEERDPRVERALCCDSVGPKATARRAGRARIDVGSKRGRRRLLSSARKRGDEHHGECGDDRDRDKTHGRQKALSAHGVTPRSPAAFAAGRSRRGTARGCRRDRSR